LTALKKKINKISKTEKRILDAIPGSAAILDEDGNVVAVNKEWKNGVNCPCWIDLNEDEVNIYDHCQKMVAAGNDYALRMILYLREISDRERTSAELTVSVNEDKNWCKVSISLIEGEIPKLLLVFNDVTSNMQALRSLRDSEEKYSHQFKHSVSGIILGNSTGKILDANPAACAMLGYSRDELIHGGRALIVDEEHPAHLEMMQTRDENAYYEGEKEYIHKDGSVIPVDITSVVYRNGDGVLNVINTFRDKTHEKNIQFSLEEERRFSQTALDSIPGIFIVINRDCQLERWNNALNHDLGYTADELKAMDCISLFDDEDKPWVQSVVEKIFETGSGNFIARISTKSSGIRFYHFHFNKFVSHNKEFLVATAVDKTDYIDAENDREKNFELMSQLFENSPLAMVMIGSNGLVQRVNDSFTSLFGYDEKEVIHQNVNKLITSEENLAESLKVNRQAFEGIADTQETTRLTKTRQKIPVLVNTVPIIYDEEVIAVYGIYVDMREQKQLENSLQRSIEEKDILLQEVHHRVKNNLAIIAGLIDLQIINETSSEVVSRLREVHSRIFSIAKIHETLYQQDDMVLIDFVKYLQTVIQSLYSKSKNESYNFNIESGSPIKLNLNQAVPLSLAINELLNIKRNIYSSDNTDITIKLFHEDESIQVHLTGLNGILDDSDRDENTAFEYLLLNTFLDQINADIKYLENGEKKVEIRFLKNDYVKGSSNALIYK
jgi:PAS domain S-box-containing protein